LSVVGVDEGGVWLAEGELDAEDGDVVEVPLEGAPVFGGLPAGAAVVWGGHVC